MESIADIITKEEILRRHKLRTSCIKNIEAAINVDSKVSAVILLSILFCYSLRRCSEIVNLVRTGHLSFLEAELKTEGL